MERNIDQSHQCRSVNRGVTRTYIPEAEAKLRTMNVYVHLTVVIWASSCFIVTLISETNALRNVTDDRNCARSEIRDACGSPASFRGHVERAYIAVSYFLLSFTFSLGEARLAWYARLSRKRRAKSYTSCGVNALRSRAWKGTCA